MNQGQKGHWWKRWDVISVIAVVFAVWVLVFVSIIVDDIAGEQEISWWEWVGVVIIPVVLAAGAASLSSAQARREIAATHLRAQDEALQQYLDHVSQLLVEGKLNRGSRDFNLYRLVAQARTLALLLKLDWDRKRQPLKLIAQLELIDKRHPLLSLKNAGLDGADLHEVTLLDVSLREADLRLADLSGANLRGSDLTWADLRGADLRRAVLTGASLTHANLLPYDKKNPAQLNAPHLLNGSDPSDVDKKSGRPIPTKLYDADLRGADLRGAILYRANLIDADLTGADLKDADLRNADLRGADLRGANLRGADLTGADLTGAQYDANTSWSGGFAPQRIGAVTG